MRTATAEIFKSGNSQALRIPKAFRLSSKTVQLVKTADGSVMVLAELTFGAEKIRTKLGDTKFTRRVEALRKQLEVEPLGESFAEHYAAVRLHLESAGQKIGDRDTIIAAHALALGAIMVTRNVSEFERVPGLQVENWEEA